MGAALAQHPAAPATSVMVVADFHMSNPGQDLHNVTVGDVLTAERQTEIATIIGAGTP